jgi:hypothetical protein
MDLKAQLDNKAMKVKVSSKCFMKVGVFGESAFGWILFTKEAFDNGSTKPFGLKQKKTTLSDCL